MDELRKRDARKWKKCAISESKCEQKPSLTRKLIKNCTVKGMIPNSRSRSKGYGFTGILLLTYPKWRSLKKLLTLSWYLLPRGSPLFQMLKGISIAYIKGTLSNGRIYCPMWQDWRVDLAGHLKKFIKLEQVENSPPRRHSPKQRSWHEWRIDRHKESSWRRSQSRSRDHPLRRHVRALKIMHLVEKRARAMPPITFINKDFKDDLMVKKQ